MIIKERDLRYTIKAKGILAGVDAEGLHIAHKETDVVSVLRFDDLRIFMDKVITISISSSSREDFDDELGI